MSQDPLHLICVEPRFPGRLGWVADWLVRRRGYKCWFYCASHDPQPYWPASVGKGLEIVQFQLGGVARDNAVTWTRHLERGLCYCYSCWEVLTQRRPRPVELIVGRSATLGSTLFAPIVYPGIPLVNYFDNYVQAHGMDVADDVNPETAGQYYLWRASTPAMDLLDIENGAVPWTATEWQKDTYPVCYRDDFHVIHDGVDMRQFKPRAAGTPRMIAGKVVSEGAKVVTFVSRSLDRVRGYDRFHKLANRLAREYPEAIFVIVGSPNVHRGVDIDYYGRNYLELLASSDPPPEPSRFWYLGVTARSTVAEVLAASDLHVAPARPFPAARSMLEAMGSGALVLAADNDPVREFIVDGKNGLLADPSDPDALYEKARSALDHPGAHSELGKAARETIRERLDQDLTMPRLADLFYRVIDGRR